MGSCFQSQRPNHKGSLVSPKSSNNPITQIVSKWSIDHLKSQWNKEQLRIIQNRVDKQSVGGRVSKSGFQRLFPKLQIFPKERRSRIYDMFRCTQDNQYQQLTTKQLINSLTLIRKTQKPKDMSKMLFYVYIQNPNKKMLSVSQWRSFEKENKDFLLDKQLLPIPQTEPLSKELFASLMESYDWRKYQKLFAFDLQEQEQSLLKRMKHEGGIRRTKGDIVYAVEWRWFTSWITYVQDKYQSTVEFKDDMIEEAIMPNNSANYLKSKRLSMQPSRILNNKSSSKMKPSSIPNQLLLVSASPPLLIPNLSQFSHYALIPAYMWRTLQAIYEGGPEIQRIFPRVYENQIILVQVDNRGKFISNTKKRIPIQQNLMNKNVQYLRQKSYPSTFSLAFYKIPGRNNWLSLPMTYPLESFIRSYTYLVFITPEAQSYFVEKYNLQMKSGRKYMKERILNYGAEINVSVRGVIKRGIVTDIGKTDVQVQMNNENGQIQSRTYQIDKKLNALNPNYIEQEKHLNQLRGFQNIGNSCFMNAVLQCLMRTPSFGGYLESQSYDTSQKKTNSLLYELDKIWHLIKEGGNQPIDLRPFKTTFDHFFPYFEGNNQHDAQQFLIYLLSRISQQVCNKRKEYGLQDSSIYPPSMHIKTQNHDSKNINNTNINSFNKNQQKILSEEDLRISLKVQTPRNNLKNQSASSRNILERQSLSKSQQLQKSLQINKQIVRFFSGTTQISFKCQKCSNKLTKIQSFFTYSLTLHPPSTRQFSYLFFSPRPTRHSIPLAPSVTVGEFKLALQKLHNHRLLLFTVFNNQFLHNLAQESEDRQIQYYLNYDLKIACYPITYRKSPNYFSFKDKNTDCSVKLQVRQRIYSSKHKSFKSFFISFLIQVTSVTAWADVQAQIKSKLSQLREQASNQSIIDKMETGSLMHGSSQGVKGFSSAGRKSQIKASGSGVYEGSEQDPQNLKLIRQIEISDLMAPTPGGPDSSEGFQNQPALPPYHIRFISNNPRDAAYCILCNCPLLLPSQPSSTFYCDGCTFKGILFEDVKFRNNWERMIIVVDWETAPNGFSIKIHESVQQGQQRQSRRKDLLSEIILQNFNKKEQVDLKCQKCSFSTSERNERILNPPNILLLHLKRFTYTPQSLLLKLPNKISVPAKLQIPSTPPQVYILYGCVIHIGSGLGGHYKGYVREDGQWYECDDERVSRVGGMTWIEDAYLLFYRRQHFEPSLVCLSF